MDAQNEKKWFVYVGDHHEGPFSLSDISSKLDQGSVTAGSFVWCEGMPDWKVMGEVPAFEPVLNPVGPIPPAAPPSMPPAPEPVASVEELSIALEPAPKEDSSVSLSAPEPEPEPAAQQESEPSYSIPAPTPSEPTFESEAVAEIPRDAEVRVLETNDPLPDSPGEAEGLRPAEAAASLSSASHAAAPVGMVAGKPRSRVAALVSFTVKLAIPAGLISAWMMGALDPILSTGPARALTRTVGDALRPAAIRISDKVPAIARILPLIPDLEDVDEPDLALLRRGAEMPISEGIRLEVVQSKEDPIAPSFYVSTNLPDGAYFEVSIVGNADTLLNSTGFAASARGSASQRLAKIGPMKAKGVSALPRGNYQVFVYEMDQQPQEIKDLLVSRQATSIKLPADAPRNRKIVLQKAMFLGGAKDSTYIQRLKEFHDKLREKATSELAELKMVSTTLSKNLTETYEKFTGIRANRNPTLRAKVWTAFHDSWTKRDEQLAQTYKKWTPETNAEYFYGTLYQSTQALGVAVSKLHAIQHEVIAGSTDPNTIETQLTEALNVAQTSRQALEDKIRLAESLPASPSGLPRREGL